MNRPGDAATGLREKVRRGERLRQWRWLLLVFVAVAGIVLVGVFASLHPHRVLYDVTHLSWQWLLLAVIAEAGSMAAFAKAQRRLLRVGGTKAPHWLGPSGHLRRQRHLCEPPPGWL
jgi:uncharacterized membrane protein YbhN (UPF0104 family)